MEKEELLSNATNEHDRELMRRELDKFEKTHNKVRALSMSAALFVVLGIVGVSFGEDYSILFFIPAFPLMYVAMYYNSKSAGLY